MGFTANQWAIVALAVVLGWLLGLLSRPSARPIRRELREERSRREALERELAAERGRHATTPGTAGAIGAAAAGRRDDLSLIRGVGRTNETRLNEAGIHSYRDLEGADAAATESRLGLAEGTITREQWREQAATLRSEGVDAHRGRFL